MGYKTYIQPRFKRVPFYDELATRLQNFMAFKLNGRYFCATHTHVELNGDGSCDECLRAHSLFLVKR